MMSTTKSEMSEKFFTSMSEFSIHIEELSRDMGISCLDAITYFCEETGAEYEAAAALVSPTLKQKIYDEASKIYSMPKMTAVTLDM